MKKPETMDPGRRSFLLSVGAGGIGVAAAAAAGKEMLAGQKPPVGQSKGYRLTEHVRKYYRTTRV